MPSRTDSESSIAFTLAIPKCDRVVLLKHLVASFGPAVRIKGESDAWKQSCFNPSFGNVVINVKTRRRRGDAFPQTILGFWSSIRDARIPAKVKKTVQEDILDTELLLGVVIKREVGGDESKFFDQVFKVLQSVGGYLFDGVQLADSTGEIVVPKM